MEINEVLEYIKSLDPSHAITIDPKSYEITEEVRRACEVNACGQYNRNWCCPPNLGALDECRELIHSFDSSILIQNIYPVEDSWDVEGMEEAGKKHRDMTMEIREELKSRYPDARFKVYSAGGCNICEKCTCPTEPCRFPEKGLASIEGMGVNVYNLVTDNGLKYINGVNTVSYVGVVLF